MSDEDKTSRDIALGLRAQELLNNELLLAVFQALRTDCRATWEATDGYSEAHIAAREGLRLEIKALNSVWAKLETLVADGNFAQRLINKG